MKQLILSLLMLTTLIQVQASEEIPTQEEVAKLYVATFNRAPDSAGLSYWTNDSGLPLSGIAQSFFDQPETKTLYPTTTANSDFITSVYQNLFNRVPDKDGLNYWENELNTGAFSKNRFIEAVINGAQNTATSNDADILSNKTTVGLYFSDQGLTDLDKAKIVMQDITSLDASVTKAKELTKLYNSADAVKNLNNSFEQENLFSADLLYPKGIIKGKNENIYTYSSTGSGSKIIKLTNDNKLELILETNLSISGLAYQSNANRFIFTTELTSLVSLDLDSSQSILKLFGVLGNKIAVANDDSFYTCAGYNGSSVMHYDLDGNQINTIVSSVNTCSSIILNNDETKLYYTSSYDGTVNEVNLQTNKVSIIASNIGIVGTFEPITLAFDSNENLYVSPAANGLYKYENQQLNKVIEPISGAGDIVWSSRHNSFLSSAGASANIVAYNTQTLEATNLTDYNNALTIAQTNLAKVLTCNNNFSVEQVNESGFSNYLYLQEACAHLVTDVNENVYIGTVNGKILKINEILLEAQEFANYSSNAIVDITYDSLNNSFISLHNINNTSVEVWKIPLENPNSASKVYTLTDITVNNNMPVVASDDSGNSYILERSTNKIYKLNINTAELTEFYNAPLDSEAITVPDMIYIPSENSLLISTIEDYQIISLSTKEKSLFAINNGSVDNFAMHINNKGEIVSVHSGQVFKINKK